MTSGKKGFTLLELLIVIAIIAILSVILIVVLNPAETLKKARDSQRISDLATMKTALGIYLTTATTTDLDASVPNHCFSATGPNTAALISYSKIVADTACLINVAEGADVHALPSASLFAFTGGSATDFCRYVAQTDNGKIDGNGWVPVNFTVLTGGAPISNLPIDPTNSVLSDAAPASTDLVYRYACQANATGKPSNVFEFNAQLESDAFTVDDDKRAKDGGDNTSYYEVGTSLRLIGTGANF